MKKTIFIKELSLIILFIVLISFSFSCNKELKEVPYSSYAAESFFKNIDQAKMAVMGVYEVMGGRQGFGFYLSLEFAIDNDLAMVRGTSVSGAKRLIGHYESNPNINHIWQAWQNLYVGINRANVVIEKIPKMNIFSSGTDNEKQELKRILGEATFLRGFYYFMLVINWGSVPMPLKPTNANSNFQLPQASREELYDQIIGDMTNAANDIPWLSEIGDKNERITKGGVLGILARVYLFRAGYSLREDGERKRPENYKEYYKKADEVINKIINSGEHSLYPDYKEFFKDCNAGILHPESSMFEVALFNPTGSSPHAGDIGTWNGPKVDARSSFGRANSFYKALPTLYYSYSDNDLRRDVAVATFEIDENDNIVQLTGDDRKNWSPGKWRRNWITEPPKNPNNTDINWILLRYADILLMKAEVENEINHGPTVPAYRAINEVRERAGLNDLSENLDYVEFFEAVKQERAWELCFEGWRKYDLIRWNILGESLRKTEEKTQQELRTDFPYVAGDYFDDNKDELFPIPQRELDENPKLKQNPGY